MVKAEPPSRTVILIPIFNDWESAGLLLRGLDRSLAGSPTPHEVVFVDDGSTAPAPPDFGCGPFSALQSVQILRLRRNLGHQRAIAVGLVFIYERMPCRAVVVMDGDGQDRPEDILPLAQEFDRAGRGSIIFAARAKRLETPLFRLLYHLYRLIHRVLTGDPVRVGNFSIVPAEALAQLVVVPEIWYHYAAAVIRSRLQFRSIPIHRGARLVGRSKMNTIGLLLHGLSAFFVYGDIVGARLLIALSLLLVSGVLFAGIGALLPSVAGIKLLTSAPYIIQSLGVVLLVGILTALVLVFTVIGSRVNIGFLPIRDCPYFVSRIDQIFPAAGRAGA